MNRQTKIVDDYNAYLSQLKDEFKKPEVERQKDSESCIVFSGELSVLKVIASYNPKGNFYVWDTLDDKGHAILLKVYAEDNLLQIKAAYQLDFSIKKIVNNLGINDVDLKAVSKWWNLCYYRTREDEVVYDAYYDRFFAANDSEKTMADLREELKKEMDNIPLDIANELVYVLGDFVLFNPFIYELQQQKCCQVYLVPKETAAASDIDNRLLDIRKNLSIPYCDGEAYSTSASSSAHEANNQISCLNEYIISIPCNELDLDTKAVGNHTFREILPNEELRKDYTCCGNEFMYLELTFYADLFGNTLLKSFSSSEKLGNNPHITFLNKFPLTIKL